MILSPAIPSSRSSSSGSAWHFTLYLCIGAYAGQVDASAGWRAKFGLEGVSRRFMEAVKANRSGVLEVNSLARGRRAAQLT